MYTLVFNSGSSSLKFQIFQQTGSTTKPFAKGIADAIGLSNSQIRITGQNFSFNQSTPLSNHQSALQKLLKLLIDKQILKSISEIQLIGHRVVHGGEKYQQAALINAKVIKDIKDLCPLAPLHNPHALTCIQECKKILPKIKQVAVFDTAFHQTIKPLAFLYALPIELYQKHQIRRYGFHGINHKYVSSEAIKLLSKAKKRHTNIISCHLGNGCSVTAIKNGKSVETSMGFTPLEGLIMGTRSGDLDPALPMELSKILKLSPSDINQFLNKKSGLLGLTGISSDMRTIHQAAQKGNAKAIFAMDMFSYRLAKYINSYIGVLGGLDALIFTGGIGEYAWYIRSRVLQYLKHLKVKYNSQKNLHNQLFFESKDSFSSLMIIPANEELEIVRQSLKLIRS